jgi:hypothetical protein
MSCNISLRVVNFTPEMLVNFERNIHLVIADPEKDRFPSKIASQGALAYFTSTRSRYTCLTIQICTSFFRIYQSAVRASDK